ncbi:MAG TPA: chromosomal replication initiator protein DnaA [Candidatus Dojkabacteria bacterium]|nr:chromosomal replication initiator protein DnaA [Candidatus Dojkabacteria bacterium]
MDKYNDSTVPAPTLIQDTKKDNNQTIFDVDEIWKVVKEQLRLYLSETSVKTWYPNVFLEKIEAGIAEISCDTQYKREWIDANNRAILKKILYSATGQNLDIMLTLRSAVRHNIRQGENESESNYDNSYNGIKYEAGGVSPSNNSSIDIYPTTNTLTDQTDNSDETSSNKYSQGDSSQFQSNQASVLIKTDQIQDFKTHLNSNPEIVISKSDLKKNISQVDADKLRKSKDRYQYYDPSQQITFSSPYNNNSENNNGSTLQSITASRDNKSNYSYNTIVNSKFNFNNFVIGAGNQMAHAVAEAVSQSPGTTYNPVFYYGGTGVGKTHLMLAIGNEILKNDPSKKIVYSPIETFLNEMLESIRSRKNEDFRRKYREVDLLIIDDIQFISNYPKTQDEIFNTFNTLYLANKQIIMASDRPPKDIQNLADRLRSRFEGGMVVDIQPPDFETRIAIIKQKVDEKQMEIPMEILAFIAQNIESNIRELEGAINKVLSHTKFSGSIPTIAEIENMLQIDIETKRKRITPKKIIDTVSDVFEITNKDLFSKSRTAYLATARQTAMYLLREELKLPLEKVAEELKRTDHTTVLHACNKVEKLIEDSASYSEKVSKCKRLIHCG